MEENKFKRAPAVERLIKEIEPEEDLRVAVIGTVVEKNEDSSSILLDDGDGQVGVIITSDSLLNSVNVGSMVRVIGTILRIGEDFELKGEIVQDFTGIDYELFKKVHSKT